MSAELADRSRPAGRATPSAASGAARHERFGVRLGGLPVIFPPGEMLEYLPETMIWTLPLSPRRVAGLMQLRGHPLAVFQLEQASPEALPARVPVLVVGGVDSGAGRAAGLVVDAPPHSVVLAQDTPPSARPADSEVTQALAELAGSVPFQAALGEPLVDQGGQRWWPVVPEALFASLADAPHDD